MLKKIALTLMVISGYTFATDYSTAQGIWPAGTGAGCKITSLQEQPSSAAGNSGYQTLFQVSKACLTAGAGAPNANQNVFFVVDGTYGSDDYRMKTSMLLYAYQTGTTIGFTVLGFAGNNTATQAEPRVQLITLGGGATWNQ